jgi:hydroxymethylglutaryl-CoA synthase
LVFRATGEGIVRGLGPSGWLARRRSEDNYLKFLAFNGLLDLELGMRAELDQKTALTALYRNRKAVMALVGGKCSETGAVQFPASVIGLAQNDRARGTLEEYPLADLKASIITFTADSLAYSPNPPVHYGAIEFEGGGRMTVEFADVEPGEVAVGTPVRMMFRIKARDERRGFIRYFWKAAPDYRGIERSAQAAA